MHIIHIGRIRALCQRIELTHVAKSRAGGRSYRRIAFIDVIDLLYDRNIVRFSLIRWNQTQDASFRQNMISKKNCFNICFIVEGKYKKENWKALGSIICDCTNTFSTYNLLQLICSCETKKVSSAPNLLVLVAN